MSPINPTASSNAPTLQQSFANAAKDGKISSREMRELDQLVDHMDLSDSDKSSLKNVINGFHEASTNGFKLFGFIPLEWKTKISAGDMQKLQQMGQSNPLAQQLVQSFTEANPPQATREQNHVRSGLDSATFEPGAVSFSDRAGATHNTAACSDPSIDRSPDWHVQQYYTGLPSEEGDCGPSCAAMVARSFGYLSNCNSAQAIQNVRETVGVTAPRNGHWAIGEGEISTAVSRLTGGQVHRTANHNYAPGQSAQMIADIKASLAKGERPMLLTGVPGANYRHYMVVSGVDENNNLILADPAMVDTGSSITTRVATPQDLEQWMNAAVSIGRSNTVMTFAG